jgi:serine protease Do
LLLHCGAIIGAAEGVAVAGLASGEVITSIGGDQIKDVHDLTDKIHGMKPGSTAQLDVQRDGNRRTVNVTVGQFPNQQASAVAPPHGQ